MKNYSNSSRAQFDDMRALFFADIDNVFTPLGDPLSNPTLILNVFNDTDVALFFTDNLETTKGYLPAHSGIVYDFGASAQAHSYELRYPKGTQLYVTYVDSAPSLGGVFLSAVYSSND